MPLEAELAASALKGSPSWNFTPGRNLIVTALPSGVTCWLSAVADDVEFFIDVEQLVAERGKDDRPT